MWKQPAVAIVSHERVKFRVVTLSCRWDCLMSFRMPVCWFNSPTKECDRRQ